MKIGLLFGGRSYEHDISIITANVIYHALKEKYDVVLLYVDKKGLLKNPKKLVIDDFVANRKFKNFYLKNKCIVSNGIRKKIDVIINLMHGINGEDGLGAAIANLYDFPYVGSNLISSSVLMDKYFTYAVLCAKNIKVISTDCYLKGESVSSNKYPVIIKPARLGSSIGIVKANDHNELISKSKEAFLFDDKIIIQPFISCFKEYNQAAYLFAGKIVTSNVEEVFKSEDILSFDDKYLNSKTPRKHAFVTDENIINKISELTRKVYNALELSGIVRIDYMVIDDEIFVNEVNTIPGSLAYYLFEERILELLECQIKTALINYQNRKDTTFNTSVLNQNYSIKK